jgi:hypothetical protein
LADIPPDGWLYDYVSIEGQRLGRDVYRPAVPIRIGPADLAPMLGLVDSGSEHTLVAQWVADDLGLDLTGCSQIELGIGGRSTLATFASVDLNLHREHSSTEWVSWHTTVGFVNPWDARFTIVLGQLGFFDEFTISMNRNLLVVRVSDREELLRHIDR